MKTIIEPKIVEISGLPSCQDLFFLFKDQPHSFLLESSLAHSQWGRYSFLGCRPFLIFKSKGRDIEIIQPPKKIRLRGDPLDVLKELFGRYRISTPGQLPPFLGGALGYFGYDLCQQIERLPSKAVDDIDLPDCYLGFYDSVLALDNLNKRAWISSCGFPETGQDLKRRQISQLAWMKGKLLELKRRQAVNLAPLPETDAAGLQILSNFSRQAYIKAILKAKEYIKKGDIYQVNLSQRLSASVSIEPFQLYRLLSRINPSFFGAFLNFGDFSIISSSPERFLRIRNGYIQTRPIKGTRPRGKDREEDDELSLQLYSSLKDRAELTMIIDVERNDLGRICQAGTVKVPRIYELEAHPTVFHLVSTIEGTLNEDVDFFDCLKATFPGGSITGAPKIRAMEIIEELEPTKRSVYTGSLGYLGFNAQADLNIVIRTFILKGENLYFQVGGGIVADSDPEAEYDETMHKAKALIESLQYKWFQDATTHLAKRPVGLQP
jgi:para-aminobenzoate synthetase component 1